jgi:TRAP transporter TAXI family solute receptor
MSGKPAGFARSIEQLSFGRVLTLFAAGLGLLAVVLWYSVALIVPPPQKEVVMATGVESGGYHAFGRLYEQMLEAQGIRVRLRTTAGASENLALIHDAKSGVNVALVQGGIADAGTAKGVVSLGRMFYEPLWVFYKSDTTFDQLGHLKGHRIAIGAEGSGTRTLDVALLRAAGIDPTNATLVPLSGETAVDALNGGTVDAVMLIFAPEAPALQKLLHDPSIKLMSMSQADALVSIYPYLNHVVLPEGVTDLAQNIPPRPVDLVAPAAALIAAEDMHPALVAQLAEAASRIHSKPNLLTRAGEFPKAIDPEFQMSADALRFYKNGPPFLQRYLPFWVANFLERVLVLLIPLATLAIPLMRGIPALLKWQVQRKLAYWYRRLERLERSVGSGAGAAEHAQELSLISDTVARMKVPRGYAEQLFNLRGHIDMVRARLAIRPTMA